MKNTQKFSRFSIILILIASCSKDAAYRAPEDVGAIAIETEVMHGTNKTNAGSSAIAPYSVVLESVTSNGDNTWTWVWSVQNLNPGNGNNGTAQGLSHWGFTLGACVSQANLVNAGYSANGTDWINFVPSIATDPSQGCLTRGVVKFDNGTNGNQKAYYRLTVNKDLPVNNNALGYYKSGSRTGCGTFTFAGIGCPDIVVEIVE